MNIAATSEADRKALSVAMTLSLVIGLLMFVMKVGAYLLTGSAAILSDAAESVVHVAAVIFAAYSLRLSYKPADESHLYGHAKISFFSAGFEGAMIILAALYIIYESVHKWLTGLRLENLGFGVVLTAAAVVINGALGAYLVWLGRRKNSIILEANGKHVLTDCWTSVAVLVGLGLVLVTRWLPFDPICGIIMACNILLSGTGLMTILLRRLDGQSRPGDPEKAGRNSHPRDPETRPHLSRPAPSQPGRRALGGSPSGISRRLLIGPSPPRGHPDRKRYPGVIDATRLCDNPSGVRL